MSLRSRWQGFRDALRASGQLGHAFALRDRGELDAALDACIEAMRTASPIDSSAPNPATFGTLIAGAQTIDEIARRLGRPELAREPLENALRLLEAANRTGHPSEELIEAERNVRARLDQLQAAP